jgi:hypothetical protein
MKNLILKIVQFYQKFISPSLGLNCRFYPSCSHYTVRVIEKYGVIKGCFKGLKRLLKCAPWNPGGVDLP